jgi:hypothetical protein
MKKLALLCSGAVVAGSLVAVSAPADAATGTPYTCNSLTGATALNSVTAPTTMVVGDSAPVSLSSALTMPSTLLDGLLASLTTLSGTGTGGAAGTITGPADFSQAISPSGASLMNLSTTAPTLPLSGATASNFEPRVPGDYDVIAGKDTASLGTLLDGAPGVPGVPLSLSCLPSPGTDPVSTIRVLSPSATTVGANPTTVAYGQTAKATAQVATTLSSLPVSLLDPAGTVRFTVGGRSVSGTLTSGQTVVALPRLGVGSYTVTGSYQPASTALYADSKGSTALKVVKDGTRTRVSAPNIRRHRVETATVRVVSVHGSLVRGKVRAVLKRGRHVLRTRTVRLSKGVAHVRFGRIAKRGRSYSVVARYLGNPDLKRSRGRDGFVVR